MRLTKLRLTEQYRDQSMLYLVCHKRFWNKLLRFLCIHHAHWHPFPHPNTMQASIECIDTLWILEELEYEYTENNRILNNERLTRKSYLNIILVFTRMFARNQYNFLNFFCWSIGIFAKYMKV